MLHISILFIFNSIIEIYKILFKALDAYCLIEIFEFFKKRFKMLNINFDFHKFIGKKFKKNVSIQTECTIANIQKARLASHEIEEQRFKEILKFEVLIFMSIF